MSRKIVPTASLLQTQIEQKEQQVGVKPVSPDSMCGLAVRRGSDAGVLPNPIYSVDSNLPQCICLLHFRGIYA